MFSINSKLPLLVAWLFISTVACGQNLDPSFQACAGLDDDTARLACFDHLTRAADRRPEVPPPPAAHAKHLSPEQQLGLSAERVRKIESPPAVNDAPAINELKARLSIVTTESSGTHTYQLDNGQVWRQTEIKSDFIAQPGDLIVISKGAMGSFWLSVNSHRGTRVKRVH